CGGGALRSPARQGGGGPLLNEGVPLPAARTAAEPARRPVAAFGADVDGARHRRHGKGGGGRTSPRGQRNRAITGRRWSICVAAAVDARSHSGQLRGKAGSVS